MAHLEIETPIAGAGPPADEVARANQEAASSEADKQAREAQGFVDEQVLPWRERRQLAERRGSLVVVSDLELEDLPPVEWLVDGLLPTNGLAALYGAPGSGKSFLALDLAFSIALGVPWLGRPVARGGTLYVAGEGVAGLAQRVIAWKKVNGVYGRPAGVGMVSDAIDLLEPGHVARVITASRSPALSQPLRLIVIDTLARSMIGDENDTRDMSRLMNSLALIRDATGATVMPVHHTRKDSDQERGSTALRGAVDTMMLCQEEDGGRQLTCVKQKDAESFAPIPFMLVAGHGSCVVASTDSDSPVGSIGPGSSARMTPKRQQALRTLADAFTDRGATSSEWLKASGLPERTFYHVRTYLVREGYVSERGTRYTLTPSGRFAATAKALPNVLQSPSGTPLKEGSGVAAAAANCQTELAVSGDPYWTDLERDADREFGAS